MEKTVTDKYRALQKMMDGFAAGDIAVAFSGGVDSALVLKLACMAVREKHKVYAVTVQTRLHPAGDLETAACMAAQFGAVHKVLEIDELAESGIERNPVNRCYLCKKSIFQKIKVLAEELGAGCILEGTNGDDLGEYRPGIRALKELGIVSPLALCGLTKAEIRELAASLDIPAANRPSSPCLATRLPYGTKISYELLAKIDAGEQYLRELGFYNVRLRVHELTETVKGKRNKEKYRLARIEVDREDIARLLVYREEIAEKIKKLGFGRITLDMEGFRSGSMDENLKPEKSDGAE